MIQFGAENVYQTCLTLRPILFDKLIKDAYSRHFPLFYGECAEKKRPPRSMAVRTGDTGFDAVGQDSGARLAARKRPDRQIARKRAIHI